MQKNLKNGLKEKKIFLADAVVLERIILNALIKYSDQNQIR